eukprot:14649373-Ditylum_brightwellii.AAC.1
MEKNAEAVSYGTSFVSSAQFFPKTTTLVREGSTYCPSGSKRKAAVTAERTQLSLLVMCAPI